MRWIYKFCCCFKPITSVKIIDQYCFNEKYACICPIKTNRYTERRNQNGAKNMTCIHGSWVTAYVVSYQAVYGHKSLWNLETFSASQDLFAYTGFWSDLRIRFLHYSILILRAMFLQLCLVRHFLSVCICHWNRKSNPTCCREILTAGFQTLASWRTQWTGRDYFDGECTAGSFSRQGTYIVRVSVTLGTIADTTAVALLPLICFCTLTLQTLYIDLFQSYTFLSSLKHGLKTWCAPILPEFLCEHSHEYQRWKSKMIVYRMFCPEEDKTAYVITWTKQNTKCHYHNKTESQMS